MKHALLAACLATLVLSAADATARSRYALVRDPASRWDFRHVQDRESRQWVHLHCELRVPLARVLPDPISTPATGDLMSTTYFTRESMSSGDFVPNEGRERDGYRVWLARSLAREADFDDSSSYGVQLSFPVAPEAPTRDEPMEVFALPAFASLVPYAWSPWRRADELRGGFFAGWEKLHGVDAGGESEPHANAAPQVDRNPFELRCRTVLSDVLYTPIEAEDPNIARPGPVPAR